MTDTTSPEESESTLLLALKAMGAIVALATALGVVFIIGTFVWSLCVGMWSGIQATFTITSEERAQIEKENKEWETDARNPKVAGKACIDRGGIPRYSNWDGEVFRCDVIEVKK